jgi:hypothetical protein
VSPMDYRGLNKKSSRKYDDRERNLMYNFKENNFNVHDAEFNNPHKPEKTMINHPNP